MFGESSKDDPFDSWPTVKWGAIFFILIILLVARLLPYVIRLIVFVVRTTIKVLAMLVRLTYVGVRKLWYKFRYA